jgi:ATP-dependent Lhr-like helicase
MRFLFVWQRVDPDHNVAGLEGLAGVVEQLDGFEVPAGAWEADVLSTRCEGYDPALLDTLCLTGRVAWGRLGGQADGRTGGQGRTAGPIRTTPIALFLREHGEHWLPAGPIGDDVTFSEYGRRVHEVLVRRGASFFHELVGGSGLLPTQVEQALGELAALGIVTSDGFAGLRALITPSAKRKPLNQAPRRHRTVSFGIESAGRWAQLRDGQVGRGADGQSGAGDPPLRPPAPLPTVEHRARTLLRRYGVIFRRLLEREANAPLWRDLLLVYRRLEARGEIRGGRFVAGMAGEQFALPEAVGQLRATRREAGGGRLIAVSVGDPLNLTGIITPGERIPAVGTNRILYEDGVPVLARSAGQTRPLTPAAADHMTKLAPALIRRGVGPALRAQLALSGVPAAAAVLERPPRRRSRRDATQAEPAGVSHDVTARFDSP